MPEVKPRIDRKSNNVEPFDRMLRRFKKECDKAGIVQEVRDRKYHEKPNDTKNQKNQDLKRRKKLNKKRMQSASFRKIR
jgi:small subunit ribosomal protein S21